MEEIQPEKLLNLRPIFIYEIYEIKDDFNGRHAYCTSNREPAKPIVNGAQAFGHKKEGEFSLPENAFLDATKGIVEKTNPDFDFLMLEIACYYLGEYQVPENVEWCYDDPWTAMSLASYLISWMVTGADKPGFAGSPRRRCRCCECGLSSGSGLFPN